MAPTFPPIYLLKWNLEHDPKELHRLEEEIDVVFDIKEAKLVLGKVKLKRRAALELRKLGLDTEEVVTTESEPDTDTDHNHHEEQIASQIVPSAPGNPPAQRLAISPRSTLRPSDETIKVLDLAWYTGSLNAGKLLPIEDYLVYEGRIKSKILPVKPKQTLLPAQVEPRRQISTVSPTQRHFRTGPRKFGGNSVHSSSQPARLLHKTTSEDEAYAALPPIPKYLHSPYSCQRPTPLHCPNEDFLSELRIIKQARNLKGDEVGVRAYSVAVAAIASYPYSLTSALELSRLPGCGSKISKLWQDWKTLGHVEEADEARSDPDLQVLDLFWKIHGVGEASARDFFSKGWRSLDDIVEQGWDRISRDQQIGVKYYDEFLQRIPREEVEKIASVILDYANHIRDGFRMVICGGYRRGKPDSGDVDVVLSHPNENATHRFLVELLESLERDEYITHRLIVSMKNSDRGQNPLNWKGSMPRSRGGFDSLDHAFLVWQEPTWPSKDEDLKGNPDARNPNVHRRVDIIISPWKTAGCAVLGWSGGTMFERDLRHYCKQQLGFKFDSTGVRRQDNGEWVDLEKGDGDLLVKERRVFSGLGLEWRDPTERCTD
ncbi:Nucleotidyltransferase [Hyaloscypha hepaticicola]|uniref:DNA polymerase n=1 Tax=Hyaloscypha hepaticicola TaxID=2082293 RepID=A0A2J6Q443_9HELO|nr:Nucleotidyltransferase [Hyaloscypha hepaticicola]